MFGKICLLISTLIFTIGLTPCAHAAPSCLGGASTSVKLSGLVANPKVFTPETLSNYKASKMMVSYFSGSSGLVTKTFVGVPLYDLLQEAQIITDSTRKNDLLRKYLVSACHNPPSQPAPSSLS